jgi:hypothetical protein
VPSDEDVRSRDGHFSDMGLHALDGDEDVRSRDGHFSDMGLHALDGDEDVRSRDGHFSDMGLHALDGDEEAVPSKPRSVHHTSRQTVRKSTGVRHQALG